MSISSEKFLRFLLASCKKVLMASSVCRKLIYDINNSAEFSDLYEHEKMLADKVRLETYNRAISKYINKDDVVVDLGTGTGILAFLAWRQKAKKIYAIDHSDFIEITKEIAEKNNIANIDFTQVNSRNFTPDEKVDVLLHEQIGDDLYNENMVENILDLKKRILKKDGLVLPGKFEIYLEPVSLKEDYIVPFLWEKDIFDFKFKFLKGNQTLLKYQTVNYKHKPIEPRAVKYFLCSPEPIYSFDLNETNEEDQIEREINATKTVINSGVFHGFCFYFKVIFDENLSFDTSPMSTNTNWGNKLFRIEEKVCEQGETISFTLKKNRLEDITTWEVTL